ncbi:indole-3-glycerol phosphate synthase TrpC [Ammoniphilus resinae]|uniref:Indole-3-glycerol phosphate synthase n=1 Tax=Ammoniphilus resinae TaxID=861532 RepID=A0ABS4GT59_9BACL|nr:indole-3-glycerol phosphate synthase [Ammoniphilus resinae]
MLHKIVEQKKKEIEQLKDRLNTQELEILLASAPTPRPFMNNLLNSHRSVSVIAEVKKASPSKGLIRPDFDPLRIADAYMSAGVDAMSVLTDEVFFQGSKEYLEQIRQFSNVPLLRKDFIIDPLQVYEARSLGADCILLIAAILTKEQLQSLSEQAKELGMDTLLEVHNQEEIEKVLSSTNPSMIGINNRNLKNFETRLETTEKLIQYVPASIPVISESGIHSRKDIEYLQSIGVRAVLVGEYFMRQADVSLAVTDLVGR